MFSALARFIPLLCIFMYDVIFVVALDKMQYYLGVWKSVISFIVVYMIVVLAIRDARGPEVEVSLS